MRWRRRDRATNVPTALEMLAQFILRAGPAHAREGRAPSLGGADGWNPAAGCPTYTSRWIGVPDNELSAVSSCDARQPVHLSLMGQGRFESAVLPRVGLEPVLSWRKPIDARGLSVLIAVPQSCAPYSFARGDGFPRPATIWPGSAAPRPRPRRPGP
jgi:hypothetical protein